MRVSFVRRLAGLARLPAGAVLAAAWLTACGGSSSSPTAPGSLASPDPGSTSPVTITILSGETDRPVAGAAVTVAGRMLKTDPLGRVSLESLEQNANITIEAFGYLTRQTQYRGSSELTLWPANGTLPADTTRHLVYDNTYTLVRLDASDVHIVLAPELQPARPAHERGAALVTAGTQNRIVFRVSAEEPPEAAVRVSTRLAPFIDHAADATFAVDSTGTITGGTIRYRSLEIAMAGPVVAHELGHILGFRGHNPGTGLMSAAIPHAVADFTSGEKLAMKMLLVRRPGNFFPDNDRLFVALLPDLEREVRVVCFP